MSHPSSLMKGGAQVGATPTLPAPFSPPAPLWLFRCLPPFFPPAPAPALAPGAWLGAAGVVGA